MSFGERITELRKENGYNTRNEFAEVLGIPSTTLRNYETGVREPGHTFLKKVSEFFNVSVDYLLCLTDDKKVLNSFQLQKSEKDMVSKYRKLDTYGKDMVDTVLQKEYDRCISTDEEVCDTSNVTPFVYAAHERTDIETDDGMHKHDHDIMNDKQF